MNTIYELKTQIYTPLKNETNKVVYYLENKHNKKYEKLQDEDTLQVVLLDDKDIKINLKIETIKVENIDNKNCWYSIGFNLFLSINNKLYQQELVVYSIIEKILKLLHCMECYYCYKINNCNIKAEIPLFSFVQAEPLDIKINWITSINLDNNWFN